MTTLNMDDILRIIAIVVGFTATVITITCTIALKWIHTMCSDMDKMREKFDSFLKEYYQKHAEVVQKEDCIRNHAILDKKVDTLHERVDELDRR